MTKRPTIKDVAAKAGVSVATVSFVMNNNSSQPIGKPVRDRVQRAARELNYHPNASAAHLARRRTRHVAIAFFEEERLLSNTFYSGVVEGALKKALEMNYHLIFAYMRSEYRNQSDLPPVISQRNAEGVLFIKTIIPKMVRDITGMGLPIVAVDHDPPSPMVSSMSMDNTSGGVVAAEHLLQLGHQRLAVIAGTPERSSIAERIDGFTKRVQSVRGATKPRVYLWEAKALTFDGGRNALNQGLKKRPDVTGVFCVNDEMAAGAIRGAHELGYRVPEQLSVVGFDDIDMSQYILPPLTTIAVDKLELGRRAMHHLIERIEGKAKGCVEDRVGVRLVERSSTGSVPNTGARAAKRT
jgi:LacI family transcriptional regulator